MPENPEIQKLEAPLNDDLQLFLLIGLVTVLFGVGGLWIEGYRTVAQNLASGLVGAVTMYMKGKA